jgi:hypothetical protein
MKLIFDLLLILFAGFWLFMSVRGASREVKSGGRLKPLLALPAVAGLVGFGGFFAQMMSAEGIIKLPKSYEWPAGYVSNVITTADGTYVVPIVPSGRVQLYDLNWHFLRGWNVNALGGDFKVESKSPDAIEVFTARGQSHYTFNENGDLVSSGKLSESYYSLPNAGRSLVVSTALLLWPFSSPFISVVVGTLGFLGIAMMKKLAARSPRISGA